MVYALKHFAIRIWTTILIGGLFSLWILPAFQGYIGLERTLMAVGGIIIVFFMLIGWIFNRVGIGYVGRLVGEATAWERDSMHYEAEKTFQKAVAVFDSFMLSPLVRRKKSPPLAARLARFYLARVDKDAASEAFIFSYLQFHPEDEEVAEHWLRQISNYGDLEKEHYELAFRIGNALPRHQKIQYLLALFYLTEERTDFPALQTYRRVLSVNRKAADDIVVKLASLFLQEGRADDWALQIYLKAYRLNPKRLDLLKGMAACAFWIKETEQSRPFLKTANYLLSDFDENRLEKIRAGFNPPVPLPVLEKESLVHRWFAPVGRILFKTANRTFALCRRAFDAINIRLKNAIRLIRQSKHARTVLGSFLIVVLVVGILILVINTIRHLAGLEKPVTPKTKSPAVVLKARFTIQVAAYLKLDHAKRYVKHLAQQGVHAYITKATGAKKVWFQVRVSHFPDKASAKAYGESLKARGIIDDFYVANYKHPKDIQKNSEIPAL